MGNEAGIVSRARTWISPRAYMSPQQELATVREMRDNRTAHVATEGIPAAVRRGRQKRRQPRRRPAWRWRS